MKWNWRSRSLLALLFVLILQLKLPLSRLLLPSLRSGWQLAFRLEPVQTSCPPLPSSK